MHVYHLYVLWCGETPVFLFGLWALQLKNVKIDSSDAIAVFCLPLYFAQARNIIQTRVPFEIVMSSLPVLDEAELPPLHVVFRGLVEPVASSHCQRLGVAGAGVLQLTATRVAFGASKHKTPALIAPLIQPRVAMFTFVSPKRVWEVGNTSIECPLVASCSTRSWTTVPDADTGQAGKTKRGVFSKDMLSFSFL